MGKLCLFTTPFSKVKSYYDMIDIASEYGINAVEGFCAMDFSTPDIENAKKIREYAERKNVVFPCFSVFVHFACEEESKNFLKSYAEVAKILGSPYLHHTIVGEYAEFRKVLPDKEIHFTNGLAAVREIYDYAENIGVKCIYEEQGFIFNGINGFGRFLAEVGRDVDVVADFANIYACGEESEKFMRAFGKRTVHAHIKDITLYDKNPEGKWFETTNGKYIYDCEPGKGVVNIKESINILKNCGYDGYYGLEFGAPEDDSVKFEEKIRILENWI